MKKLCLVLALVLMLCGCASQEAYETVMDSVLEPKKDAALQMVLDIPEDAVAEVLETEQSGQIYFCEDYIMTLQTLEAGDLEKTVRQTTGYDRDQLQMMQTGTGDLTRYECVWIAAGENGDQVCRACILDDGNYHYILTVMADADKAGELTMNDWQELFGSFRVMHPEDIVSSGS